MKNEKILHSTLIASIVVVISAAGFFAWQQLRPTTQPPIVTESAGVTPFTSAQDFTAYLDRVAGLSNTSGFFAFGREGNTVDDIAIPSLGLGEAGGKNPTANRVSETNVQVSGIDEPDIVKTDGANIFISSEQQFYYNLEDVIPLKGEISPTTIDVPAIAPDTGSGSTGSSISPSIIRPEPIQTTSKVVKAFPLDTLSTSATIDASGNLLLDGNSLVFLNNQSLTGYSVVDPAKPEKKWTAVFPENSYLVTARLFDGKIYTVTQTSIIKSSPCPMTAVTIDDRAIAMPCTEIYHPVAEAPINSTYTAMILDPKTGNVEKKISFVGSSGSTVVYMSEQALYVTYSVYADPVISQFDFLTTAINDLIPANVRADIEKLQTYDISRQAKLLEIQTIIGQWQNGLSADALKSVSTKISERQQQYQKQHLRTFETTNIVKLAIENFTIQTSGAVPGRVLNQFALDEYQGSLRIATTNSGGFFGGGDSANDVYILNANMKSQGSILDLAPGEQIYSARFVGQVGYLVTFKQIDPFFVLDLANPSQPKVAGELKIPGFSSYLHPLNATQVLGVGQEEAKTKLSLFDVSDPSKPVEKSKLLIDRSWSEVQTNHHAFLQDAKHQVVFLPAGENGEVISYAGNTLSSTKTVTGVQAQRAVYLNDFLYVIGQDAIVVLNEADWTVAKELTL